MLVLIAIDVTPLQKKTFRNDWPCHLDISIDFDSFDAFPLGICRKFFTQPCGITRQSPLALTACWR
jgi:hypothetical protein